MDFILGLPKISKGAANSWTSSLPPEERDEDLRESAPTDQAQPSKRMTQSMTHDTGLGQDPLLANASAPSLPRGSRGVEPR